MSDSDGTVGCFVFGLLAFAACCLYYAWWLLRGKKERP